MMKKSSASRQSRLEGGIAAEGEVDDEDVVAFVFLVCLFGVPLPLAVNGEHDGELYLFLKLACYHLYVRNCQECSLVIIGSTGSTGSIGSTGNTGNTGSTSSIVSIVSIVR